jgi:FlaA1/EpsC-like NDP-sugar epimerase
VCKYKREVIDLNNYLNHICNSETKIIIYGAGKNTSELFLKYRNILNNVVGIAVTDCKDSPNEMEGVKVMSVEKFAQYADKTLVLITPREELKDDIIENLKRLHFNNYKWIDISKLYIGGTQS